MAESTVAEASELVKFQQRFYLEYVRDSGFKSFMGNDHNNPFVTTLDLMSGGRDINIPWVGALNGGGVGAGTLTGNEEVIDNDGYQVKPVWRRNAVVVKKSEEHKSSIQLLNAGRTTLKMWAEDDLRDKIIFSLGAIAEADSAFDEDTGHSKQVNLAEASVAQQDAYSAANEFRLLFGDSEVNYDADFSAAIVAVTAGMTLDADAVTNFKVMAKRRNKTLGIPSIKPIRVNSSVGREFFVMFTGSLSFRDLKTDTTITQANREARERDVEKNPIFQDGDLIYDGVIIKEIPEIESDGTLGASSAPVSPTYFCGAQALGIAWGQMTRTTKRSETDYGFVKGAGVEELRGVEKLFYNEHGNAGLQHGMITGWFGAA